MVAIQLLSDKGTLNIYNIYNDCTHSNTVRIMEKHMRDRERGAGPRLSTGLEEEGDLWLGDFNRHNPWWEDPCNARLFTNRNLADAQILIDLLSEHSMDLELPPAIPTIRNARGNLTRPDNVFISDEISNWISICEVLPDLTPPNADHFPIFMHLDFPVDRPRKTGPWNFRATDWVQFKKELTKKLDKISIVEQLQDKAQVDAVLKSLEEAVLDTMEATLPRSNLSPYAKWWWSKDLEAARTMSKRLAECARKYARFPNHSSHREAKRARNDYNSLIHRSKQQHWDNWLENVSSNSL